MRLEAMKVILELLSNTALLFAEIRMFDTFLGKEGCRRKWLWVMFGLMCVGVTWMELYFGISGRSIVVSLAALLALTMAYQARMWKRLLFASAVYTWVIAVRGGIAFVCAGHMYLEEFDWLHKWAVGTITFLLAMALDQVISEERQVELPLFCRGVLGVIPVTNLMSLCWLAMAETQYERTLLFVSGWILLIDLVIYCLHHTLVRFYSETLENQRYEQMAKAYRYQLALVSESQERMDALRHDMKHHIIELTAMIDEKENPAAVGYLKQMTQFMLNPKEYAATGNKDIDGVLNYLLRKAEEELCQVHVDIRVPQETCWGNFDICVILGNLVENAVREAAGSEEKYLEIHIRSSKGLLLIHIENSYSGKIEAHGQRFKTTQSDTELYGIGLENVKRIVSSNGGEMKIHYTENRFRVNVLLYEESNYSAV